MKYLYWLLALFAGCSPSFGASLQSQLEALAHQHHGKVALFAKNLTTGDVVAIDADTPVQTASVIKLPIFVEAFAQIQAGKHKPDDKLPLHKDDQVGGSGVLQFFFTPNEITFQDALTLMMIVSDNTATNLVIDQVGIKNVNDRITRMGLKDTYLYKKVFKPAEGQLPADQKKFGLGKTTAREMARVLESIVNCDLGDKKLCDQMIDIMRAQQYRNMVPHYLESVDTSEHKSPIADKLGALNKVRNDVAVVSTQAGPIIISAFTYDNQDERWIAENEGELLIAKMAKLIVDAWSPKGLGDAHQDSAKPQAPGSK